VTCCSGRVTAQANSAYRDRGGGKGDEYPEDDEELEDESPPFDGELSVVESGDAGSVRAGPLAESF
jgi:hypothetical protein